MGSGAATTITTNPIWLIQTHQATRGAVEVRLPHVISSYLISSDAPPPSHSQQDPAQGERKVVKKKPGMLQAAREIIGEKGITVSVKHVIVAKVMGMLNVWNVCTGIMAWDRTCLGSGDQSCPTSQYRGDRKMLYLSSLASELTGKSSALLVHRLRAARPDLSTLSDQEDGRQGTLKGYRHLLARSYRQGHRHGWDLPICELSL